MRRNLYCCSTLDYHTQHSGPHTSVAAQVHTNGVIYEDRRPFVTLIAFSSLQLLFPAMIHFDSQNTLCQKKTFFFLSGGDKKISVYKRFLLKKITQKNLCILHQKNEPYNKKLC